MNRKLFLISSPLSIISRSKGYKAPGGIQYPGGIVYYPRYPDHKDPEYTPSKLFRVERITSPKGVPFWQKNILKELRVLEESRVSIVKNIPEVNSKLWKVKHLVRITPIVFPYGEPTADDIKHTILKENGECVVTKTLEPLPARLEALEEFDSNKKKMDSTTIKRDSRYKWNIAYSGGF